MSESQEYGDGHNI